MYAFLSLAAKSMNALFSFVKNEAEHWKRTYPKGRALKQQSNQPKNVDKVSMNLEKLGQLIDNSQ